MLLAAALLLAQDVSDPGKCEAIVVPTPWISRDRDYPADARAAGAEGKVRFSVSVDAEGCATACRITESSGAQSLDDTTCALIMRNSSFKPARAPTGERIASTFDYSFWWFLPEPLPAGTTPPEPLAPPASWVTEFDYPSKSVRASETGDTQFVLAIDAEGIPTDCQLVASSGSPLLDATTCTLMMRRARFKPARDAAGVAVASRWKSMVRWALP